MNVPDGGTPAEAIHAAAFDEWYDATYGKDYPNGTEFDAGEMWEAFRAGAAQAAAAEREACIQLARKYARVWAGADATAALNELADLLAAAPEETP